MPVYFRTDIIEKVFNVAEKIAAGNKHKEVFVIKRLLVILQVPGGDEEIDAAIKRINEQYLEIYKEPLIYEEKNIYPAQSPPATQISPVAPEAPHTSWFYRLSRIFIKKDDPGTPPAAS